MRILTIGSSPYLLTRNGRMNGDIIKYLRNQGHYVASAVWHHDEGYFLPDEGGVHTYEQDGKEICKLIPFVNQQQQSSATIYEIMKKVAPDLVVTVGDYKDTDFVYSIKAMLPSLFRWIAVLPIDCLWINTNHKEFLEHANLVISTSEFGFANLSNICNVDSLFIPYGPNHDVFNAGGRGQNDKIMRVMNASKNAQSSNVGAFIKALGECQSIMDLTEEHIEGYLHTNLYDPGDYDLRLMISRYGADNVKLPEMYVSVLDGPSDAEMANLYRKSAFYIDCSVKSATALSMQEAMACGCVPIGVDYGRVGEIISEMPEEFQLFVPYETYIGSQEEEYSVISHKGLVETLIEAKQKIFDDTAAFAEASKAAIAIAKKSSYSDFLNRFGHAVNSVMSSKQKISVDSF